MALRKFDDANFLTRINPYATGAPQPTVVDAVRRAASAFFFDTDLLVERYFPQYGSDKINRYELTPPTNTYNKRLLSVTVDGRSLRLPHEARMEGDELVLTRNPPDGSDIEPVVALGLHPASVGVEADLIDPWIDIICCKALELLYLIPGREWTNQTLAAQRHREYRRGVLTARNSDLSGSTRANAQIITNRF